MVGTLLVPLSALAAVVMLDTAPSGAATESTSATTLPSPPVPSTLPSPEADLRAACGADGMELVDLERVGAASDIQQAALDALRPICGAAGIPLPEGPPPFAAPDVAAIEASGPTPTQMADDHSDDDDDDHEDDDGQHGDDDRGHEDEHDD